MEIESTDDASDVTNHLPRPDQSTFTTVMNSVGNWSMISGAVGWAAIEGLRAAKVKIPKQKTFTIFASGAGAAVGAALGLQEARQLSDYRNAVKDEFVGLNRKVSASEQKIAELQRALDAKETASAR